jgi:hypothetical protein
MFSTLICVSASKHIAPLQFLIDRKSSCKIMQYIIFIKKRRKSFVTVIKSVREKITELWKETLSELERALHFRFSTLIFLRLFSR